MSLWDNRRLPRLNFLVSPSTVLVGSVADNTLSMIGFGIFLGLTRLEKAEDVGNLVFIFYEKAVMLRKWVTA